MPQAADSGYYHQVWKKISADPGNTVAEVIDGAKKAQEENFIYITEVFGYQPHPKVAGSG